MPSVFSIVGPLTYTAFRLPKAKASLRRRAERAVSGRRISVALNMQTTISTEAFARDDPQDVEVPTGSATISFPRRTSAAGTFQSPDHLSNEDS